MNGAISVPAHDELDSGEADYFSAILAQQNAAKSSEASPEALAGLSLSIVKTLEIEGVKITPPKPVIMTAVDLAAFGAGQNITVFHRQSEGIHLVIAVDQQALLGLVAVLLGGKPGLINRMPSRIEAQILQQFMAHLTGGFILLDTLQTSLQWQSYLGARLPIDDAQGGPSLIVMMNRRAEKSPVTQAPNANHAQNSFLRQAVGNGTLEVDYVLNGGEVSLALLRNLNAGSIVPLGTLSDCLVEARANGKAVFSGVLHLSEDKMRFGVTRTLAEETAPL